MRGLRRLAQGQGGYTLVEVVITSALSVVVIGSLTSVILTTVHAADSALGRIEASGEIRNFELRADDDFARAGVPVPAGCGTAANPCTTTALVLTGVQVTNSAQPVPATYQVTYTWDGTAVLDRQVSGGNSAQIGADVTGFAWYVDGSSPNQTVVVIMTVTVRGHQQSQTFRFYPRLNP